MKCDGSLFLLEVTLLGLILYLRARLVAYVEIA